MCEYILITGQDSNVVKIVGGVCASLLLSLIMLVLLISIVCCVLKNRRQLKCE